MRNVVKQRVEENGDLTETSRKERKSSRPPAVRPPVPPASFLLLSFQPSHARQAHPINHTGASAKLRSHTQPLRASRISHRALRLSQRPVRVVRQRVVDRAGGAGRERWPRVEKRASSVRREELWERERVLVVARSAGRLSRSSAVSVRVQ